MTATDPAKAPTDGPMTSDEILVTRRDLLGPSLSLSYRTPLHIVRGEGAHLYDADGRAYLDCVNNVAHVGHAHPRVVAAGSAQMRLLNTNTRYLHEAVVERKTPILGICLGMQLFASHSQEGDAEGLGWIDADVVRFAIEDTLRFKVPQMGWNGVRVARRNPLLDGVTDQTEFYFVHAYHMACRDREDVLCETDYGYPFTSVVQRGNLYGVQFHPEKSHDAGEVLLRNFLYL